MAVLAAGLGLESWGIRYANASASQCGFWHFHDVANKHPEDITESDSRNLPVGYQGYRNLVVRISPLLRLGKFLESL